MNEQLKPSYEFYKEKIAGLQSEFDRIRKDLIRYKTMVNNLLLDSGEKAEYGEVEGEITEITPIPISSAGASLMRKPLPIKMGELADRPFAKRVRHILELNERINAEPSMSTTAIIEALKHGGERISEGADEKRIRTKILKNTANFQLVGEDHFKLRTRGTVPRKKKSGSETTSPGDEKNGEIQFTTDGNEPNTEESKPKTS